MDEMTGFLNEVTETQLNIQELSIELVQLMAHDPEVVNKLTIISRLASRSGLLVDQCRKKVGFDVRFESWTDWLLPPGLREDNVRYQGESRDG